MSRTDCAKWMYIKIAMWSIFRSTFQWTFLQLILNCKIRLSRLQWKDSEFHDPSGCHRKMQMLGGLWIFIPFLQRYCLNLFKFFLTLCKYSWRAWCQDPIGHGCLGSILIIQYAHFWPRGDTPTWGAVNLKFNLSAYLHNLGGKCIITKDQGVGS